jgi:beta-lactamase regulating signal transducer with metallopeptidase domain
MNAMLQRPFEVILEASLSAAILAIIIAAVQWTLRGRLSPAWRFALWTPVLLRLFLPVFPESAFSLFNAPRWYASWKGHEARPPIVYWLAEERPAPATIFLGEASGPITKMRELEAQLSAPQAPGASAPVLYAPAPLLKANLASIAAALWLSGVVIFLGWLGMGTLWMSFRLRREGRKTPSRLDEIMRDVAPVAGFRIQPHLKETALVESPALFGVFRPVLLLPPGFLDRLSETEIRHVFLHELAHLKRRDLWVNWLMAVAQAAHWFNPVVWLVFRRMRLERELACDEMALRACRASDPKAYGQTILRLLEGVSSRPALSALVGIAEEKHSAKQRLQQIAAFRGGQRKYWVGVPALVALVLVGLTNAQAPRKPSESRTNHPKSQQTPIQNNEKIPEPVKAAPKTFEQELSDARIDQIDLEGMTLTKALERLQKKLPRDLQDISFRWYQTTNLTSGRAEGDRREIESAVNESAVFSVNAIGYIETEIGKHPTPADQILLSRKHLAGQNQIRKLRMEHAPLPAILETIIAASQQPLRFWLQNNQIVFSSPKTALDETVSLIQDGRTLLEMGKTAEAKAKFQQALEIDPNHRAAAYYLNLTGQRAPQREQTQVTFPSQADRPANAQDSLTGQPVGFDWYLGNTLIGNQITTPHIRTNRVFSSPARQAVLKKLQEIKFDIYEIPTLQLFEVVKDLAHSSRHKDPEKVGVNFVMSREIPDDIATRLKDRIPNVDDCTVSISPPLRNVRLIDILDAIVRVAVPQDAVDPGLALKYSIEEYGVVFSYRSRAAEPLYTRSYRVDPNTFVQGLEQVSEISEGIFANRAGGETNRVASIQEAARNFFAAAGVDFGTNQFAARVNGAAQPPQKAIFFNDRSGTLLVRATLRDLDVIEAALQALNVTPPQVMIHTQQIKLKDQAELDYLTKVLAQIHGKFRGALTDREFRAFKQEVEKGDRFFVRLGTVTSLSGRPVRTSLDEHAVDVRCDYADPNAPIRVEATSFHLGDPKKSVTRRGAIYDGQTFVVLPKSDGPSPGYVTFITATLVDPAGNRVFNPHEDTVPTDRTPPQDGEN